MRFLLLLLLVACQPQAAPRSLSAAGASGDVENTSLIGSWTSSGELCYVQNSVNVCSEKVRLTFTQTRLSFVAYNPTTNQPVASTAQNREINFLSDGMFYDFKVEENVTFSVNGNTARICYDLGCHDLYR